MKKVDIYTDNHSFLGSYVDTLHIHLQWFAAEDEGRSFDPTQQKIREARKEGRVAKSNEIPSALVLLAGLGILWGFSSYYATTLQDIFRFYVQKTGNASSVVVTTEIAQSIQYVFRLLLPIAFAVFCIAIFGNIIQFGVLFSIKAINPKWSKISFNLSKWIEKSISKQGWYVLGTSLFKIALISFIVFLNVRMHFSNFIGFSSNSFQNNVIYISQLIGQIIIQSGIALLILGILDFRFQSYMFKDQLKMTKEELKKEFKETEGDPEIKKRIKSRMQEYLSRNMPEQLSQSDVVITNPTHFAVALKYDMHTMEAPQVMAKGVDSIARRIRMLAAEYDVPIIENKPLARALYADLEVGDVIPEKYFRAVVLVFREVYTLKGVQINE